MSILPQAIDDARAARNQAADREIEAKAAETNRNTFASTTHPEGLRGGGMKDPCPTCDGDGVLGTSPEPPPCPECMGGEETRWQCFDEETYETGQVASSARRAAEIHWIEAVWSTTSWDWFQADEGGVAQKIDRPKDWDEGGGPAKQDAVPDLSPDPLVDKMASWEGPDENPPVSISPADFSHGDCYLEPADTMPCGTCFPTQRARWDADHGDPQDWEDVSADERASVRRAIDKFRSLTEPARKSAAGARSDPATRPATISSTGPAADGDSIPPSAAVSPRGAR